MNKDARELEPEEQEPEIDPAELDEIPDDAEVRPNDPAPEPE